MCRPAPHWKTKSVAVEWPGTAATRPSRFARSAPHRPPSCRQADAAASTRPGLASNRPVRRAGVARVNGGTGRRGRQGRERGSRNPALTLRDLGAGGHGHRAFHRRSGMHLVGGLLAREQGLLSLSTRARRIRPRASWECPAVGRGAVVRAGLYPVGGWRRAVLLQVVTWPVGQTAVGTRVSRTFRDGTGVGGSDCGQRLPAHLARRRRRAVHRLAGRGVPRRRAGTPGPGSQRASRPALVR
jgi:hypothetical protein